MRCPAAAVVALRTGSGGRRPLLLAGGRAATVRTGLAGTRRPHRRRRRVRLQQRRIGKEYWRARPWQHTARHGGRGRARGRRSQLLLVTVGVAFGGHVAVAVVAVPERDSRRRGASARGCRGDRHHDAGGGSLCRAADGEEGCALPAAEVRMLIGAALASLRDLAEAVKVELSLKAGELVLLEKPTEDFGAQSSVVADL